MGFPKHGLSESWELLPFFLRLGSEKRQRAAPVEAALGAVELLLVETDVFLR